MKKIIIVAMACAIVACNTVKEPIADTDFSTITDKTTYMCGVVNSDGDIIVPMEYESIKYDASDNIFIALNGNHAKIFTSDGTPQCEMNDIKKVGCSLYKGKTYGRVAIYNATSNFVSECYDDILIGTKQLVVKRDGLYGVLSRYGREILPLTHKILYVVDIDKAHYYFSYNVEKNIYERYNSEGQKEKITYSVSAFNKIKNSATDTWLGGFTVKKL